MYSSTKYLIIILICTFSLSGQEWKVLDKKVNRDLIIAYKVELDKYNEENNLSIADDQERPLNDDILIVSVEEADSITITSISFDDEGYQIRSITFKTFLIKRIDQELIDGLKSKKYAWDDLDWRYNEIKGLNIYKYRDYKKVRDLFWWTYSLTDISPFFYDNSFVLRPVDPIAFIVRHGFEEMGFPSILSRNTSFIFSSEPTQLYINLPFSPSTYSAGKVHPLESTKGLGLRFDLNTIGGEMSRHSIEDLTFEKAYDPNNIIFVDLHCLLFWSGAFENKALMPGRKSINDPPEKVLFPAGVQRVKVGMSYTRLNYGKIDSTSNFTLLKQTEFGNSFKMFVRWEYVSDEKEALPGSGHRSYSLLKAYIQANMLSHWSINGGAFYSLSPSIKVGLNFAWVQDLDFTMDNNNSYNWKPGFVISPNIVWSR